MCLCKFPVSLNAFAHISHFYGLPPVCVHNLTSADVTSLWMKRSSNRCHIKFYIVYQQYVSSSAYISSLCDKMPYHQHRIYRVYCQNHAECVLMCLCKCPVRLNLFPQTWHIQGWSSLCVLMCWFKFPVRLNAFPQTLHIWDLSLVCVPMWLYKPPVWLNVFPQTSHL
jgi:hypothetical protein